jgi:hypothetical protein
MGIYQLSIAQPTGDIVTNIGGHMAKVQNRADADGIRFDARLQNLFRAATSNTSESNGATKGGGGTGQPSLGYVGNTVSKQDNHVATVGSKRD